MPLKAVDISCQVKDFPSEITINQNFVNVEDVPIEAIYHFPIEEEAAVISFKAEIEGKIIDAVIKDKEEARKEYEKETKQNKNTSILLEETKKDIFKIKLGQLKHGSAATIEIKYISELPIVENDKICLTIPTAIAPRYGPSEDTTESANTIKSLQFSKKSPAPLTFKVEGEFPASIEKVSSPTHSSKTSLVRDDYKVKVQASLATTRSDLDRDIVVYFEHEKDHDMPNKPTVMVEKGTDTTVAVLSLIPYFKLKESKVEMIFLIDRSGSMGGDSIKKAKEALILFLHALPMDCYFNIISFGSHFSGLFSEGSRPYSEETLSTAKAHVKKMDSDFGGTEIYPSLKHIFENPLNLKDYKRQVIVLTDGEVSDAERVVGLVRSNNSNARVFGLGIGAAASRSLVKGIARGGHGTSLFAKEDEDLRPKVTTLMKNSLQPGFTDIKVEWKSSSMSEDQEKSVPQAEVVSTEPTLLGYNKSKVSKLDSEGNAPDIILFNGQVPSMASSVFDGNRSLIYHVFEGNIEVEGVRVTAVSDEGPLAVDLQVTAESSLDLLHRLAARKKIQELEEEFDSSNPWFGRATDPNKDEIKAVALSYSLTSRNTSFIGVDRNTNKTQ